MSNDRDARIKILEDTISGIEKTYGKGTIMKLGDGVINPVESIPTGSLSLDYALVFRAGELLKSTVRNLQEKLQFVFTSLQKHKKEAGLQLLLMPNTQWI